MSKTIKRPVTAIEKVVKFVFPIIETVAPKWADSLAVSLFITPFRYPFKADDNAFLDSCESFHFEVEGVHHVGYKLGEGPAIICMHGWSGRATQFRFIAERLVANGYQFIAFDALGHGRSDGKESTLFSFRKALVKVIESTTDLKAVVAHSLGAAAVSYMVQQGTPIPALVTLGAPVIAEDILDEFLLRINGHPKRKMAIRKASQELFEASFDDVVMDKTFSSITCPVLAIHGELDFDVPPTHLDRLREINPRIETMMVPEIGHRRILREKLVLDRMLEWLNAL